MEIELVHALDRFVDAAWRGKPLFRYTYRSQVDPFESRRPFFHPLRTLGGNEVTIYRPHDHRWHVGLSMTSADLSGQNFWGGPTYVRDKGYVGLDNVGRQEHRGWSVMRSTENGAELKEEIDWITADDELWIKEHRRIGISVRPDEEYWSLRVDCSLQNVSGRELAFGSPTTNGRPNAGYGGLAWRGPRSFTGGRVLGPENLEGEEAAMGARAEWIAFTGAHDGTGERSTLVFIDGPSNPRHPTKWFVRSQPYAFVSFAFMFDEVYRLPADGSLDLSHVVAVLDGDLEREAIEGVVSACTPARG